MPLRLRGGVPVRLHLLALSLFTLLTGLMTWPLATAWNRAIPGDGFDGWQNFWNLWWMKQALVDGLTSPFWTDILYFPTGVGLYFHTLNPLNGLVTLPIQLTVGLYPAYNAVVLISWVLGGYGMFLLVRYLIGRRSWPAAFFAGVIFTFAPYHMAHLLGHMQLMSIEWIPFYLLYLLRTVNRLKQGQTWRRDAVLASLFLVGVGLCDWYYVLYLILFTGFFTLWQLIAGLRQPGPRAWQILLPPISIGILFLIALSPILVPMISEALRFRFMERPDSDLYILSATLIDFFIPNRLHTLARPDSFSWPGNQIAPVSERSIAIGYTALTLALVSLKVGKSRLWLGSALFFLLLALGPKIHLIQLTAESIPPQAAADSWTPYGVLNRIIPFMRISRSVSRFALMVQLSVAVAAGIGAAHLLSRLNGGTVRGVVATLFCILMLFEYWVAPFPLSPPDTPAFYERLAREKGGAVLNLPMNYDRPGYLLYQTVHQHPLAVAYISRDDPRTLTTRAPFLQQWRRLGADILKMDPVESGESVLADLGVGWVILDRYKMPDGLERSFTTALASEIFEGNPPRYEDERITVYAVDPVIERRPYLLLGSSGWGPALPRDNERVGRSIGEEGAWLSLHHFEPEDRFRITFSGSDESRLDLKSADGQLVQSAGAKTGAAQGFIELRAEEIGASEDPSTSKIQLLNGGWGELWIESIEVID